MLTVNEQRMLEVLKMYVDHYDDKLTEREEEIRLAARQIISETGQIFPTYREAVEAGDKSPRPVLHKECSSMTHQEFKQLRETKGYSRRDAANSLGRHPNTVRYWETNRSRVPKFAADWLKNAEPKEVDPQCAYWRNIPSNPNIPS